MQRFSVQRGSACKGVSVQGGQCAKGVSTVKEQKGQRRSGEGVAAINGASSKVLSGKMTFYHDMKDVREYTLRTPGR